MIIVAANSQGWQRRASSHKGYSIDAPISKVILRVMTMMIMIMMTMVMNKLAATRAAALMPQFLR